MSLRLRRWPELPPRYLEASTEVRVRFHEVDTLAVVWHGHYVAYMEVARDAFGREYGLTYEDLRAAGYVVPLVHVALDFLRPARFGDLLTVRARLHPEEAARIRFTYAIEGPDGERLAVGQTAQAFTDLDGRLILSRPAFYGEWLARWGDRLQGP